VTSKLHDALHTATSGALKPTALALALALGACAAAPAVPQGHKPSVPVVTEPGLPAHVRVSIADRTAIERLCARLVSRPVVRLVVGPYANGAVVRAELEERPLGDGRFETTAILVHNSEWLRRSEAAVSGRPLAEGPWLSGENQIRRAVVARLQWEGRELSIAVEGTPSDEEIGTVLSFLEQRQFGLDLSEMPPPLPAEGISRIRKSHTGRTTVFVVRHAGRDQGWTELVIRSVGAQLTLVSFASFRS